MAKQRIAHIERDIGDIWSALRKKYAYPQYTLAFEVKNGAGASYNRSADAMAFGMWPSVGLEVTGIEVKVSVSDLLSELRNPAKASETSEYCHRWYLATTEAVANTQNLERVPLGWGVLVLQKGKQLKTIRKAALRQPRPLDVSFLASILRSMKEQQQHMVLRSEIADQVNAARDAARELTEQSMGQKLKMFQNRAEAAEATIKEFERESGIRLPCDFGSQYLPWNHHGKAKDLGRIVHQLAAAGGVEEHLRLLAESAIQSAERCAAELRNLLEIRPQAVGAVAKGV